MSARTESVGHGCGKIAFSVLTVRSLPFTFYAFAYSLEKKNSLAFLEFADNTNRIGAGNAALFELVRTEYIEQSKRQRSGSKKVRRDGGDLSLSLRCCGDFLEAIYSPPSSSAPHLTALPKEPLGLCRLVVVSKCSGCRSLGKNGVIEIAAAKVRGWEDGGERGRHLDYYRPPVSEFCHRIFPIHTESISQCTCYSISCAKVGNGMHMEWGQH